MSLVSWRCWSAIPAQPTRSDVPARLARAILRLAEADPDGVTRRPRLVQSDLAGTTRETLNKWLGFYEDQGLIRRDEGRLVVLRPDELRRRIS